MSNVILFPNTQNDLATLVNDSQIVAELEYLIRPLKRLTKLANKLQDSADKVTASDGAIMGAMAMNAQFAIEGLQLRMQQRTDMRRHQ